MDDESLADLITVLNMRARLLANVFILHACYDPAAELLDGQVVARMETEEK